MLYLKYLLEDFTELSIETQCDIVVALQEALDNGMITPMHIKIVRMYVRRYSIETIAFKLGLTSSMVRDTLTSLLRYLETKTGYSDRRVLRKHPKYNDSILARCNVIAIEELTQLEEYERAKQHRKIDRKKKKKYDRFKEEYSKERIGYQGSERKRQRFVWYGTEDSDDE